MNEPILDLRYYAVMRGLFHAGFINAALTLDSRWNDYNEKEREQRYLLWR